MGAWREVFIQLLICFYTFFYDIIIVSNELLPVFIVCMINVYGPLCQK